jgi:hypothetical protein
MPSGGSRCREHAVPRRGWAHERATDPANSKGDFSVPAAPDTDAEGRYADVVARRDAIRTAWEAEGSPLLTAGSTGQLVEHPFVKMLLLHGLLSIAARTRAKAPRRPGALGRHEAVDRRVAGGEAPSGDLVARPDAGKWKPTAVSTTVGPLVTGLPHPTSEGVCARRPELDKRPGAGGGIAAATTPRRPLGSDTTPDLLAWGSADAATSSSLGRGA